MLVQGVNERKVMDNQHTYHFSQTGGPWLWLWIHYTINLPSVFTKFSKMFLFEQEYFI